MIVQGMISLAPVDRNLMKLLLDAGTHPFNSISVPRGAKDIVNVNEYRTLCPFDVHVQHADGELGS